MAALAARMVDRPVKLVLTRAQMFTSVGHRSASRQRLRLGTSRNGRLLAVQHESTATIGTAEMNLESPTALTPQSYACPNVGTRERQVRLNIPNPGWMRAPGKAEGERRPARSPPSSPRCGWTRNSGWSGSPGW